MNITTKNYVLCLLPCHLCPEKLWLLSLHCSSFFYLMHYFVLYFSEFQRSKLTCSKRNEINIGQSINWMTYQELYNKI